MADKAKESKGPTCACGKGDLYEDWVRGHDHNKEEDIDSTILKLVDESSSSSYDANKANQKGQQT